MCVLVDTIENGNMTSELVEVDDDGSNDHELVGRRTIFMDWRRLSGAKSNSSLRRQVVEDLLQLLIR